jgi:hypothetical protein
MARNKIIKIAASEEEVEALEKLRIKYKQKSQADMVRRALWSMCLPSLNEVGEEREFDPKLFTARKEYNSKTVD